MPAAITGTDDPLSDTVLEVIPSMGRQEKRTNVWIKSLLQTMYKTLTSSTVLFYDDVKL